MLYGNVSGVIDQQHYNYGSWGNITNASCINQLRIPYNFPQDLSKCHVSLIKFVVATTATYRSVALPIKSHYIASYIQSLRSPWTTANYKVYPISQNSSNNIYIISR